MIINVYERNTGSYDKLTWSCGLISDNWERLSDSIPLLNKNGKFEYELLIEDEKTGEFLTVDLIRSDADLTKKNIIHLTKEK